MAFEIQASQKKNCDQVIDQVRISHGEQNSLSKKKKNINHLNSNDDDFIGVGLGGMGYSHRSYKKIILNCKFITSRFQTKIFKNKYITNCNVSKYPYQF